MWSRGSADLFIAATRLWEEYTGMPKDRQFYFCLLQMRKLGAQDNATTVGRTAAVTVKSGKPTAANATTAANS